MEEGRPDNNIYDFMSFIIYDFFDDHDVDIDDDEDRTGAWGAEKRTLSWRKGNLVVDTHGDNDEHDSYYDGNDDHVDLGGRLGARDLVRQSRGWGGGGCQLDIMQMVIGEGCRVKIVEKS